MGYSLKSFARINKVDLVPLACSIGLDPQLLKDHRQRLDLQLFCRLLGLLAAKSGDDYFGLAYGLHFNLKHVGPFHYMLANAPTVRASLEAFLKLQPLVGDTAVFDLEFGPVTSALRWRYAASIAQPQHYADFRAVLFGKLMRQLTNQDWRPVSASLMRERPASLALHRSVFGKTLTFGSAFNCIEFSSDVLDSPVTRADPALYEIMRHSCEREVQQLQRGRDILDLVRERILATLPLRLVTLERVAATLDLSDRSLQRRLTSRNTTFEQLVEETRRDLSDSLLLSSGKSLIEISSLCGYSSASAYSRAAKLWYGMSPAAYRKRAQGAVS